MAPIRRKTDLARHQAITVTDQTAHFRIHSAAMNCGKCKRPMAGGEPVYRLFLNVWDGWRTTCAQCEAATKFRLRSWLPARPCAHCSRPVFRDRERKGTCYFVCSDECRQAIHNANYRRRLPRSRIARQCGDCGATFTQKRGNAKFCSVTCEQRAYGRASSR